MCVNFMSLKLELLEVPRTRFPKKTVYESRAGQVSRVGDRRLDKSDVNEYEQQQSKHEEKVACIVGNISNREGSCD